MPSEAKRKPETVRAQGVWERIHAGLMPDYNRKATVYWWTMVLLGSAAFVRACAEALHLNGPILLQIVAGAVLAMVIALVPVKVPRTNQSASFGDLFPFLLLLMHGPAAACVAAALAALVSSWRSSRRWTTRIGSATITAFNMYLSGQLLHGLLARDWFAGADHAASLVLVALVFGLLYAGCDAVLMSTVARFKRNERPRLSDLGSIFGWVGAASAVASGAAALLFVTQRAAGMSVMLTVLPIMGLLLTTLHYFSRQQEAEASSRLAVARAAERETELAISLARQREAEQAALHLRQLEISEGRFQNAFTHASIGMALVSQDSLIHQSNPALQRLFGFDQTEITGRRFADFIEADDRPGIEALLSSASTGAGLTLPSEIRGRRVDGSEVWASVSCSMFSDTSGAGPCVILQVQDVTARRRAELELKHRAYHDKLTGLANREHFNDLLSRAIEMARVGAHQTFAVLFLDFDRFKLINDSKGHGAGDEFLVMASQRLSRCLRSGDLLARLGGDEFAILANNLSTDREAVDLAERLLATLKDPLRLSSLEVSATASIGITFSSIGYTRPEDMLRDADIAMYRAKADGKARYALFDVRLHTEVTQRVRLEGDLRNALDRQELAVAYQPIYDLNSGALKGFEALTRWTHVELGPVSPAIFIPIAEESGLITRLTEFVLQRACGQLQQWSQGSHRLQALTVHVNVAAGDLADPEFIPRVRRALATSGLAPEQLVIELTENILMAQLSAAMATLASLRAAGVGLSVDDFGTGYSSLAHLAVLPIDSLKIDMSFVRNLQRGSNEAAVIKAIVLLAGSLGKQVIAEGIETPSQLALLRELGCDCGQGFLLSRPLLADAAGALVRTAPGLAMAATWTHSLPPTPPLAAGAVAPWSRDSIRELV